MKYTDIKEFEKRFEEAAAKRRFPCVYLILSEDKFQRKIITDKIAHLILSKQYRPDLSLKTFDLADIVEPAFRAEVDTLSLFDDRKVVLLEGETEKFDSLLERTILQFCQNAAPTVILVVSLCSLNKNTKLYKEFDRAGIILEIPEEKGAAKDKSLLAWVHSFALLCEKEIDPQASQYLIKQVNAEPLALQQEIKKLAAFIGDRKVIQIQDIKELCTQETHETIWQLGDALFNKNLIAAFRISRSLLQNNTAFLSLARLLRNQFQTGLQVATIIAKNGDPQEVTKKFPYMKGFVLDKQIKVAKHFGRANFKKGILIIDEMELKAKNNSGADDLLTDILISKLSLISLEKKNAR